MQTKRLALLAGATLLLAAGAWRTVAPTRVAPPDTGQATAAPDGMGLHYDESDGTAKLAFGAAASDDVGLMLECDLGSRRVRISDLQLDPGRSLALVSGARRLELKTDVEAAEGSTYLTATAPLAHPALQAFRRTSEIAVEQGKVRYVIIARPAEHEGLARFFKACDG